MDVLQSIRNVFDIEIQQLLYVRDEVAGQLEEIIHLIDRCHGKVVLSGMGKPGHIGRKISATMSSLGIPSYFLHPAEGLHGDLGTLSGDDIIILFSNSGESSEVCNLLPNIKMIGTPIIGVTCSPESTLAKYADYLISMPKIQEACALDLAPTSSTTAELVIGDALAVVVSQLRNFKKENFAIFHPGGALGKKLLTHVSDIMHSGDSNAIVNIDCPLLDAINEMATKGLGAVLIVEKDKNLAGIITDGDLRRALSKQVDIYHSSVQEIMTKNPIVVDSHMLAADALKIMIKGKQKVSVLPVVDEEEKPIGLIRDIDIINQNIFI